MTFDEAKQKIIEKYNTEITQAKKSLENYKLEDEKYKKVRNEIVKWNPPTDEHKALKNFALEQIYCHTGKLNNRTVNDFSQIYVLI